MTHKDHTSCENFSQIVWLLLDNDLPDEARKQWQSHLESCSACRQELEKVQSVLKAYRTLPERNTPEAVIQAAIAETQAAPLLAWRRFWSALQSHFGIRRLWRPALATAGVGAVVLLFFNLSHREELDLTWEPSGIEVAITRLDSALASQRAKIVFDSLPNDTPSRWDMEAAELQERIAALMNKIKENGL